MDIIPFFQEVLIVVAIIFAVVLLASYIYTKFIKSDKEEIPALQPPTGNKTQSKPADKKRTINYTASVDAQKLYVNTEEHRKHVVTNKVVSKPKRFQVLNKTGEEE